MQVLFDVEEGGERRLGSFIQKIWAINTIELGGDLAMILPLTKPSVADLPLKTEGQRQITRRFIDSFESMQFFSVQMP